MGKALDAAIRDPEKQKEKLNKMDLDYEVKSVLNKEDLDEIEQLLTGVKKEGGGDDIITIEVGEDNHPIKVKKSLDGRTERLLGRLDNITKRIKKEMTYDYDEYIDIMCQVASKICVDHPWNKHELWERIYDEKGMEVLGELLEAVMGPFADRLQKMPKFRENRRR
jgi:hypothetical protein